MIQDKRGGRGGRYDVSKVVTRDEEIEYENER